MVDADRFVSGTSIRWRALGTTLIGGGVLAAWHAVSELVLSIGDGATGLLGGAAAWGADAVGTVAGTPGDAIAAGFDATVAFVGSGGLAGFVLAVAFTLTLFYVAERVISDE